MDSALSIYDDCTLMPFSREILEKCEQFTCGNKDLDDFFQNDVFVYEAEMLGKCYCWLTNGKPHCIVALVTVSNDSIKSSMLPANSRNRFNRIFDNQKRNLTYPATLIGRFVINSNDQGQHIGKQVLEYIKKRNIASANFNGARFLVVDAYNIPPTLHFYESNGFAFMHKDEDTERAALKRYNEDGDLVYEVDEDEHLLTRMMYFDLKKMAMSHL